MHGHPDVCGLVTGDTDDDYLVLTDIQGLEDFFGDMEVDPFDSNVSDTARIAYGNSSSEGSTAISAFSASAP